MFYKKFYCALCNSFECDKKDYINAKKVFLLNILKKEKVRLLGGIPSFMLRDKIDNSHHASENYKDIAIYRHFQDASLGVKGAENFVLIVIVLINHKEISYLMKKKGVNINAKAEMRMVLFMIFKRPFFSDFNEIKLA